MKNKWVIVRANSTSGTHIVERNTDAPRPCAWSKADIADYAETKKAAERIARECNAEEN